MRNKDERIEQEIKHKIKQIKQLEEELRNIAMGINPNKPWKRTLREDVGVVI